jgi:hypothetical protein
MTLVALAATVLSMALAVSLGTFDPFALAMVTVAGGLALAILARRGDREPASQRPATAILAVALAASLVADAIIEPGIYVEPSRLGAFRPTLVVAAFLVLTLGWRKAPGWIARTRFPALLVAVAILGVIVIRASPTPAIDTWVYRLQGARALLDGFNPYSVGYPNIYGPGTPYLAESLLSADGRYVLAYPYTPLTLLLDIPGAWLGDPRWISLAALLASAWLVHHLGRSTLKADLAAALLLLQPSTLFVVEQAWTEPLVLALVAATAWAVARCSQEPGEAALTSSHWIVAALAAGTAAASKQYAILLLLPLLATLPAGLRLKASALATGWAVILVLPFLVWSPAGLIRGLVSFQLEQPFRRDALSWPAAVAAVGGPVLPTWPAFLAAAGVVAAALRRSVPIQRALLTAAAAWLAFVILNKQAFCNYYWLAEGLLCAVAATWPSSIATSDGNG